MKRNKQDMAQQLSADGGGANGSANARRLQRLLAASACCGIALAALLLAAPGARASARDWFSAVFSPREYILTPREERAQIPLIESAITVLPTPAPQEAQTSAAPVVKTTFVKEGWESVIDSLTFTFEELFYNGEEIFISGYLEGDLRNFYARYTNVYGIGNAFEASVMFILRGEQTGGYMEIPYFEIADKAKIESAEHSKTRFAFICGSREGMEGLTGEIQFDMTLTLSRVYEGFRNDEGTFYNSEVISTMSVEGLRFHVSKSAEADETIPLNIESVIGGTTVEYFKKTPESYGKPADKSKYHIVAKSMEGGRLVVEGIRKRFTNSEVKLTLYLPEDWDAYDWHGLMYQICFEYIVGDQAIICPISGRLYDYDKQAHAVRMHLTGVPIRFEDWAEAGGVTMQLNYYPPLPGLSRGITLEGSQIPITGARVTIPEDFGDVPIA